MIHKSRPGELRGGVRTPGPPGQLRPWFDGRKFKRYRESCITVVRTVRKYCQQLSVFRNDYDHMWSAWDDGYA